MNTINNYYLCFFKNYFIPIKMDNEHEQVNETISAVSEY